MSSTATILLPILLGFGFVYISSLLSDDEKLLAIFLRFLFIPFALLSVLLATTYARLDYSSDSELVSSLGSIAQYSSYVLYLIGIFYLFIILKNIYEYFVAKKQKKESEQYDG